MNDTKGSALIAVPRQLRLSTILASLCAPRPADEPADSLDPPLQGEAAERDRERSKTTIGEIIDRTSHAGFGFFMGFLALISVPFPGLSLPFGAALAFGAIQMILGFHKPWLPKFFRRRRVSPRVLNWLSLRLARWTRGLERIIRPRLEWAAAGPLWTVCGLCLLTQALALSLPLPIPGSNFPFILTIVIYAIGILEADGLLILLGHALVSVQAALAVTFSGMVMQALHKAIGWMMLLV